MTSVTVDPGTLAVIRSIGREVRALKAGQFRHGRASQAAYRSIEAGGQRIFDEVGNLRTIVGAQEDGTYAVVHYGGDPPPVPSAPLLTNVAGAVTITWDGFDENDELGWPADFDRVEVHVSGAPGIIPDDLNQIASFGSPIGGSTTVVLEPGQPLYVVFTSVNKAGAESGPSYEEVIVGGAIEENPGADPGGNPEDPGIPLVTSRLGVIRVDWAGSRDPSLAYLEVHRSTNPGFTPIKGDPTTLQETLYGHAPAFSLFVASGTYGVPYFFRFMAVNKWGNSTLGGVSDALAVQPLVNTDIIGQIIAGANIVNGTLVASDKIIGNTITGALIQALAIEAGHIKTNAITADKVEAGAITGVKISGDAIDGKTITGATIRTSASGARVTVASLPNAWQGQNWGQIHFYSDAPAWEPGSIWAVFDAGASQGTLRIASPYTVGAGFNAAASLTLGATSGGTRQATLYAQRIDLNAETYYLGSGAGSIDFRMTNTDLFQIFGFHGYMNFNMQNGLFNTIGSWNGDGSRKPFGLVGSQFNFNSTARAITIGSNFSFPESPILIDNGADVGITFRAIAIGEDAGGTLDVVGTFGNNFKVARAWKWIVVSDASTKDNAVPVTGALDTVMALAPTDYDVVERDRHNKQIRRNGRSVRRGRGRGLVADAALEVAPELVSNGGPGELGIDLYALSTTTLAALQELVKQLRGAGVLPDPA